MKKVLEQYAKHITRILTKAQGNLTYAQKKGLAYYTVAAERIQALIDAPTPAWVHAQSKKRSAFD
jgi:hypothetical protein